MGTGLAVRRLVKFEGEGSLKAFCDLEIGHAFLVKGLRVVKGKNGLFVSMPREQGKDQKWYDSVMALTPEAKEAVNRAVLEAYDQSSSTDAAPDA